MAEKEKRQPNYAEFELLGTINAVALQTRKVFFFF